MEALPEFRQRAGSADPPSDHGELCGQSVVGRRARTQNVLRAAGLTGWVANVVLRVGGFTYYPDLLFETAMLIVEFDGFAVHGTRQAFESDGSGRIT